MTTPRHFRSLALLAAAAFAPTALAQNAFRPLPELPELRGVVGGAGAAPAPRPRTWFEEFEAEDELPREHTFVEVRAFAAAGASAGLSGGGNVATQWGGWAATLGSARDDERISALSVRTEAFFYNFGGANELVPGSDQPFNDLYRASLSGMTRTAGGATPGVFAGFQLALGGEDNASAKDSLVVGGVGGLLYEPSRELTLELGVAALSRLEDDPWIWPFIGLRWQASERLSFEAQGTSLEARVALDEHWSVFGRAEYSLRQFRLNDDNPLPRGVLRDEEIRAALGLARRGDNGFEFELLGGLDLWRELSTLEHDGTRVSETEVDPAPFIALSLTLAL